MKLKLWLICAATCALFFPLPAAATLGEDVSSVSADQKRLEATVQVTDAAGFTVYRLQLPSGLSVKQYVSTAGMVFALSWQGPDIPDLQQLLGRYFQTYLDALNSQQGASGPRTVERSGLVVQSGGHMRAFFGRAYVPLMLPRGVSEKEIQ